MSGSDFSTGILVFFVGIIALTFILRRPWLGVAILVVYLPFNSLGSQLLGGGTPGIVFGAVKDSILLILFVVVIFSKTKLARVPVPIVAFVITILLLAIASSLQTPNVQQALYGIRNDYLPLLMLIVVPGVITERSSVSISKLVAFVAQIAALVAIYTYSLGLAWLFTLKIFPLASGAEFPASLFSQGSVVPRAFSPYTGPNEMALAMVIFIAIICCRSDWKLKTRIVLSILPIVAISLSQSRSGLIGLGIVAVVVVIRWLSRAGAGSALIGVVTAGAAALVGFLSITTNLLSSDAGATDLSAQGHAVSFAESIPKLISSLFGAGVGQVGPRAALFTSSPILVESYWLVLGLEAGLLVMVLYIALLLYLAAKSYSGRNLLSFTALAAIAGSLVSQIVLPTLQDGSASYTLWLAVGLGFVALRAEQSETNGVNETKNAMPSKLVPRGNQAG
ncbi:hypothetical protein [Subtercola sp. RTI3]|uniref:hypothetical protein n=1 Tax=Subtercola sp. RTI3 TaxID=3048639 RepID=UPI002B22AF09|nr:hypothetical protein [Subtercola sp. RTI3]MEA9986517.1 hypothetical protein [Subtercola sp. RTI3]